MYSGPLNIQLCVMNGNVTTVTFIGKRELGKIKIEFRHLR
jgi:hypothetical protein